MPDLADLVVPETQEDIEETLLSLAEANDLPTTAWGAGSALRVFFGIVSEVLTDAWYAVPQIANGVVLERSTGRWLDLLASSQYDTERTAAVFAAGTVRLTDAGGGPHTITAGAVVVATSTGLRYRNTTGGTLTLNGTLDVTFSAEMAGSAYNVANETITELVTSLPTVTASNLAVGTTGTWITTAGADVESDATLRTRLQAQWGTLSTGSPESAYLAWALSITGVSRAKIVATNPAGPGTVYVYVDSSGAVAAVDAYIAARAPAGSEVVAAAATTTTLSVPATVYVSAGYLDSVEAAVVTELATLSTEIDIGGIVRQAEITERIMALPGVVDVVFSGAWTGTPNVQLTATQIVSLSTTALVFVES